MHPWRFDSLPGFCPLSSGFGAIPLPEKKLIIRAMPVNQLTSLFRSGFETRGGGGIMTLEIIRDMLGWCIVINWILLAWWLLFFILAHDWMYRIHGKWFNLSVEKFDAIHYSGMAIFKTAIFVFNLVPYLALRIVG
jgi:hypothetical protein